MNYRIWLTALMTCLLTAGNLLAEERAVVICDPDSDSGKEISAYSTPGGFIAIEKLTCGDQVTLVSSDRGFSKVITPKNKVGYIVSTQLRKLERAGDTAERIAELEAELHSLKGRSPDQNEMNRRIELLEKELQNLKDETEGTRPQVQPEPAQATGSAGQTGIPAGSGTSHTARGKEFPRAEVFGGYSFARIEGGLNLNGWEASVAGNLTRYFGIVGDISGHYANEDIANPHFYTFLAGPRFSFRRQGATGFVHALVGITRLSAGVDVFGINVGVSDTMFAMAFGGGVDVNVSNRLAIRAIQAEYLPVRFEGETFNNVRVGAGVAIKF